MNDTLTPLRDAGFIEAFLDVLIPPSEDGMLPGAGTLGITPAVAASIEADPILGPFVRKGLYAIRHAALERDAGGFSSLSADARVEVVEAQLAAHPMLIGGVLFYLYQAYYQHPRVLQDLGEPPRPPFPEGYDLEPTDPGLLRKLRERARSGRPA